MGRGSGTQEKILAYIKTEIRAHGYPPSVREIANAVGLKSTATVHDHLQRLERQGYIRRYPLKPRALEIVKRAAEDHQIFYFTCSEARRLME